MLTPDIHTYMSTTGSTSITVVLGGMGVQCAATHPLPRPFLFNLDVGDGWGLAQPWAMVIVLPAFSIA